MSDSYRRNKDAGREKCRYEYKYMTASRRGREKLCDTCPHLEECRAENPEELIGTPVEVVPRKKRGRRTKVEIEVMTANDSAGRADCVYRFEDVPLEERGQRPSCEGCEHYQSCLGDIPDESVAQQIGDEEEEGAGPEESSPIPERPASRKSTCIACGAVYDWRVVKHECDPADLAEHERNGNPLLRRIPCRKAKGHEYKPGDKLYITGNTNGHAFGIGEEVFIVDGELVQSIDFPGRFGYKVGTKLDENRQIIPAGLVLIGDFDDCHTKRLVYPGCNLEDVSPGDTISIIPTEPVQDPIEQVLGILNPGTLIIKPDGMRMVLDFTDQPEIHEYLVKLAKDDMRTPEMEIMMLLRTLMRHGEITDDRPRTKELTQEDLEKIMEKM